MTLGLLRMVTYPDAQGYLRGTEWDEAAFSRAPHNMATGYHIDWDELGKDSVACSHEHGGLVTPVRSAGLGCIS